MSTSGLAVRSLEMHAAYRCERTGVCCSAGWEIPVENRFYRGLRDALATGVLPRPADGSDPLPACGELPEGYAALLARKASGGCVFLERGADGRHRCAVHERLGEDALPVTCRMFPRVCVITPLGIDVSLSHFCPTAAALLFGGGEARIVSFPPAFPPGGWYEGLDGRDSPGPLLRPGVFLGWSAHRAFERFVVETLAGPLGIAEALDDVTAAAERARTWTPDAGPLDRFLPAALADPSRQRFLAPAASTLWDTVRGAVPAHLPLDDEARRALAATADLLLPTHELAALPADGPVRRYLAARAFASWLAVQGQGLRTAALGPRLAWTVLRVQAGRLARERGGLDLATLREAVRSADLVLVHLASPEVLAARLSAVESA